MEATVLVSEIGGLGQVCWDICSIEIAARVERILSAMTQTIETDGGAAVHVGPIGISYLFTGHEHSSRALGGAIRLIDLFRSGPGDFSGLNLRIGIDTGEVSVPDQHPDSHSEWSSDAPCGEIAFDLEADETEKVPQVQKTMVPRSGGIVKVAGNPFFVAADLVSKARANTAFLSERVRDHAGEGFCFDEANKARLRNYPTPLLSMVLCGRC